MSGEKWTPDRLKEEAIKAYATHGYKPIQRSCCRVLVDGTICACGLGAILLSKCIPPQEISRSMISLASSLMSISPADAMNFVAGFDDWNRSTNPYSPYALAGRDVWEAVRPREQATA